MVCRGKFGMRGVRDGIWEGNWYWNRATVITVVMMDARLNFEGRVPVGLV